MAAKTKTTRSRIKRDFDTEVLPPVEMSDSTWRDGSYNNSRKVLIVVLLVLLLGLFWYKTNSWPIVGVVNYKPIWRWQLNELMYNQVGKQAVDNLVTEQLIRDELENKEIDVKDADVDAKINDIKKQIGSDAAFNQALSVQGMTIDQLKKQIKLQLGLEKLVEPSTESAKLQEEVYAKVQDLKAKQKVWLVPRLTK